MVGANAIHISLTNLEAIRKVSRHRWNPLCGIIKQHNHNDKKAASLHSSETCGMGWLMTSTNL